MAASNTFWGIEIGASSIKAMKLERVDDTSVKVLDFAVIQHPKPLSTPGVDANDVLRVSLGALASQYDLGKAGLAVSVPGHAAFARFTKLPPVEPNKIPDIVKFEAMQQIPFPLEQVEWDYQVFMAKDSPDVGAGIFAITKERVSERLSLLAELGLTPDVLTLSPLAVYNAIAFDLDFKDDTPGTIIVDVGTTSTDIIIAEPGRMWVRTFPIGGHQFTDALVNQFQLSYPKAEKLKREAEDSKHARQVFQAMRPVFTDLATEVQRSIGYYNALHKDANLVRLIGVGSTFRLPGLRKYFKQQLSIEVYRVEELKKAKFSSGNAERDALYNDSSLNLCSAYGLAIQGLEMNACAGNLMPVSVIRESMWVGKTKYLVAAAACAVLASGLMFFRPVMDDLAVKNRLVSNDVKKAIDDAGKLQKAAQEAGVLAGSSNPDMRAANMVELLTKRGVYAHIVNDVGLMFEAANASGAKGADGKDLAQPVCSLISLATEYEPPTDPAALTSGFNQPDMGGDPFRGEAKEDVVHQRVRCTLELGTDVAEARRFAKDTLVKWLSNPANVTRAGVPYRLALIEPTIMVTDATGASGTAFGSVPGGELGETTGRGRGRAEMTAAPIGPPPEEDPDAPPAAANNGAVVIRSPGMGAAAGGDINTIAPLPPINVAHGRTKVTVQWLAVVEPVKPADATQEGSKK